MKILMTLLFMISVPMSAKEWVFFLNPDSIQISNSRTPLSASSWRNLGHCNFVNLSFFDHKQPVGYVFINGRAFGRSRKTWPLFCIKPTCGPLEKCVVVKEGFSGSHELVVDYKQVQIKTTRFSRRRCPRTCIGVNSDGSLVVFITSSMNLNDAAKRMKQLGCYYAVNADGGSSTMLTVGKKSLFGTSRKVPVILSWK